MPHLLRAVIPCADGSWDMHDNDRLQQSETCVFAGLKVKTAPSMLMPLLVLRCA
jgi:hypothetical protein